MRESHTRARGQGGNGERGIRGVERVQRQRVEIRLWIRTKVSRFVPEAAIIHYNLKARNLSLSKQLLNNFYFLNKYFLEQNIKHCLFTKGLVFI